MRNAIAAGPRSCEASRLSVHAGQCDAASRAWRGAEGRGAGISSYIASRE